MVFSTSGVHFREYRVTRRKPLIPIEQEGSDLVGFRDFFAPRKHIRNGYVYVGFSRGVFKKSHFRENKLNPPSPDRPLLEAFSCLAPRRGGTYVTRRQTDRVTAREETTPPPRAGTKTSRSGNGLRCAPVPPPSLQSIAIQNGNAIVFA